MVVVVAAAAVVVVVAAVAESAAIPRISGVGLVGTLRIQESLGTPDLGGYQNLNPWHYTPPRLDKSRRGFASRVRILVTLKIGSSQRILDPAGT